MSKIFNWDEFKSNFNIGVLCKTERLAKDFCKQMNKRGLTWISGKSYLDYAIWDTYEENTCYTSDGLIHEIGFYGTDGIIVDWSEYSQLTTQEEQPKDLRDMLELFMLVEFDDESKAIVSTNGEVKTLSYNFRGYDYLNKIVDENLVSVGFTTKKINKVYSTSVVPIINELFSIKNRDLIWGREEYESELASIKELEAELEKLESEHQKEVNSISNQIKELKEQLN